jgi:hypothetical protein
VGPLTQLSHRGKNFCFEERVRFSHGGKNCFEGAELQSRRKLQSISVALATDGIYPAPKQPFHHPLQPRYARTPIPKTGIPENKFKRSGNFLPPKSGRRHTTIYHRYTTTSPPKTTLMYPPFCENPRKKPQKPKK